MKKLYTLTLAAMLVAGTVSAQRNAVTAESKSMVPGGLTFTGDRTTLDTLTYTELFTPAASGGWSPTLWGAAPGGYIFGVNGYGDLAKGQAFYTGDLHPGINHHVTGAGFWWGAKQVTSGNPNSKVMIKLYRANGLGTTTGGANQAGAPGTELASVDLLMSAIDTSNFQYVTFSSPVWMGANQEYIIAVDFTATSVGDTVGIVTSASQEVAQAEVTWERWAPAAPAAWYTIPGAGWGGATPIDFAAYIMATVSLKNTDVEELESNGLHVNQNIPNPAVNFTNIDYTIDNPTTVTLDVYDVVGNKVLSVNEGTRGAGAYRINLDTKALTAGTYFYTLTTDRTVATRKMSVAK